MRIIALISCSIILARCSRISSGSSPLPVELTNRTSLRSAGNGYKTLYRFKSGSDGAGPVAGLLPANGKLYGTTAAGGNSACYPEHGCGIVFEVGTTGKERVLYRFKGSPDGQGPASSLVAIGDMFYGTTAQGGGGCSPSGGCGTVFSVSTSGKEKVIYRFKGRTDGSDPQGLEVANGTLYGVTSGGGDNSDCSGGCGTVFELSTSGEERILYRFKGGADGAYPAGSLVAVSGKFYGATTEGGTAYCVSYTPCGTVFAVSTSGKETVLYRFKRLKDGSHPGAGLISVGGALYGTTYTGGAGCASGGCGTVFKLSTSGKERVLHSFTNSPDGSLPNGPFFNLSSTLYGTTNSGGKNGVGTVFSVSTSGKELVLYSFVGGTDGEYPDDGLVAQNGALYGTTGFGGTGCGPSGGCGTVFEISP